MKKHASLLWLGCFGLYLLSSLLPQPVSAQQQTDGGIKLSISAESISLSSPPNKSITQELRIRNSGIKTETLEPNILVFHSDDNSGDPQLRNPETKDEFVKWISFSPQRLTLAPNQWGSATMTIDIPDNAAYGYYFAVAWGRVQPEDVQPAAANLEGSVAQLVLLEVPAPGTRRELRIESFEAEHAWYEFLPVTFHVTLKNTGNIHTTPFGNIFITDRRGNEVSTIKVNPLQGAILPNSSRVFTADWAEGFPRYTPKTQGDKVVIDSNGKPIRQLTWELEDAEWWRFGKYTANLIMAYTRDGQDIPLTAEVSFWIIPWRLILLIIAIPVVPALLVFIIMKLVHRRRETEDY